MVEVLALEVDLRATELLRPALGMVDGARSADVVLEFVAKLGLEIGIVAKVLVRRQQFTERVNQRLSDEDAAVRSEMSPGVGQVIHPHCALLA